MPSCHAIGRYMGAEAGAGSPPENTLEAMGPVLESVLGSLTQEYEKRLFSKDHEVKGAQVSLLKKLQACLHRAGTQHLTTMPESPCLMRVRLSCGRQVHGSGRAVGALDESQRSPTLPCCCCACPCELTSDSTALRGVLSAPLSPRHRKTPGCKRSILQLPKAPDYLLR